MLIVNKALVGKIYQFPHLIDDEWDSTTTLKPPLLVIFVAKMRLIDSILQIVNYGGIKVFKRVLVIVCLIRSKIQMFENIISNFHCLTIKDKNSSLYKI